LNYLSLISGGGNMPPLKNYKVDMKSKYEIYIKLGVVFSLLLMIAAFKFSPKAIVIEKFKPIINDPIKVEEITPTNQKNEKPGLPKPVIPVITLLDVTEDLIFEDVSIDYTKVFSKLPDVKKDRIVEIEDDTFLVVEQMPEIIGGINSIQSRLKYPDIVRRIGVEGKVIVAAIIDKEGNVIDVELLKSVFPQLDEIALNAVKEAKFLPGKQRGKPVKVKIAIPINFRLK